MVDTDELVIGAVSLVGGAVLVAALSDRTSSSGPDLPGPGDDSVSGDVPSPDSPEGTAGTLDPDFGGADGIVNPDNWESPHQAYVAELYDTDTGE